MEATCFFFMADTLRCQITMWTAGVRPEEHLTKDLSPVSDKSEQSHPCMYVFRN